MIKKVYKDLFNLAGISGHEQKVRAYMQAYIEKYPNYEIVKDNLGSIFAVKKAKKSDAPIVMVAGHMDEVGLMVVGITKEGFLKLQAIGGLSGEVFISQVMHVHTKNGVVKGIIGALPPHLGKANQTSIQDLLLDVGARNEEEALSFGIQLGDMVLFENQFAYTHDKKRVISKAIDNRYGCGLALEMIETFHEKELPYTLVIGATVQEEVGLRGAETSVNMMKPDVFIALDASPVHELDKDNLGGLGKGFLLRMYDPRNMMHKGLLDLFRDLAKKHRINYQYFVSKGGTDAAKALDLNDGVLATTIGLPARYIHSTAAMMDLSDLKACRKMTQVLLETLTPELIQTLQLGEY